MSALSLYAFPGACSQVTLCALEQANLRYDLRWINLLAGAQSDPEYRELVPTKKVPALFIGSRLLLENAAILFWIARTHPASGVLPATDDALELSGQVSALSFCSGTLHPLTRAIANPARLTSGNVEEVRATAKQTALTAFGLADQRFRENRWWFERESIIDVYVNWAYVTARRGGLDPALYPALEGLHARLTERPAYRRALEIENQGRSQLGL